MYTIKHSMIRNQTRSSIARFLIESVFLFYIVKWLRRGLSVMTWAWIISYDLGVDYQLWSRRGLLVIR